MRKNIHGAFLISVIYDWQLCWWLEDRHDVAADDADRWDQGDLEGRRNCFWHWTLKGYGTSLCMPESVFYTSRGSCGVNMSLYFWLDTQYFLRLSTLIWNMNNETAKFVLEEISPSSFLQQATNTFPTKSSSQKNWKVSYIGKLYSRKTDPKWGGYPFHVSEMSRTLYFSVLRWDISVVLWAKRQNVINLKLSSKKFGSRRIRRRKEEFWSTIFRHGAARMCRPSHPGKILLLVDHEAF